MQNIRLTIHDITKAKRPLVCLTSYTADIARLVDPHVDLILVGDSVGMTLYGFQDTLQVTLDTMIAHGAAVTRSTSHAVVVVDLPFGTYEKSPEQALESAQRVMKVGCAAVKLEGGQDMAAAVKLLVQNNIPVVGHIGLMPQSIEKMGGFKIQGKDVAQIEQLKADIKAIAAAGAFAIVIEGVIETVARELTQLVKVPTIGIGASAACDGQILVVTDLLGLTPKPPRFVKTYADTASVISKAVENYAADVRAGRFPADEHTFKAK